MRLYLRWSKVLDSKSGIMGSNPSRRTKFYQGQMFTYWITWPQEKAWNKEYPPEMLFLRNIALPSRENTSENTIFWNWFATPTTIQINIYNEETIVLFKLRYSK